LAVDAFGALRAGLSTPFSPWESLALRVLKEFLMKDTTLFALMPVWALKLA
jgi:hypothetical protein